MEVALIVAGGSGQRMQLDEPKQFIILSGLPVLMHTILAFRKYSRSIKIILVIPESEFDRWGQLVNKFGFKDVDQLVPGGQTRFQSVKNGLQFVNPDDLVAIHDGVRPVIDQKIIRKNFEEAALHGNAITVVKPKDSLRKISGDGTMAVDRNQYLMVQTPQTFRGEVIKNAYQQKEIPEFTDDATVAEYSGVSMHLVDGAYQNIKITTNEDLKLITPLLELPAD